VVTPEPSFFFFEPPGTMAAAAAAAWEDGAAMGERDTRPAVAVDGVDVVIVGGFLAMVMAG